MTILTVRIVFVNLDSYRDLQGIQEMIITDLFEKSVRESTSHNFLLHRNGILTYEETLDRVNRVANTLIDLGIERGDPVGILFRRQPELVISFLAIAKVGGVVCPLNYQLEQDQEVEYIAQIILPLQLRIVL